MKLLLRYSLVLVALTVLLTSCKKDPLKGKLRYKIELRVKGENLGGLGAGMEYSSVLNPNTNLRPGPSGQDTYALLADSTYSLGEFGWYDVVDAKIFMRNVTCNNATRPGPNSWLRMEMLVNGLVIDRVELNSDSPRSMNCASPPYAMPYLGVAVLASSGSDWDD
ncbi:hypothetical protein GCM10027048_26740 [Hymenobacter coalescens]